MAKTEEVKSNIQENLPCKYADMRGDGQHFEVVIMNAAFHGQSCVRQHQIVYRALGERMRDDIHALSMTTYIPEEWTG